ncbi:MAG: ABC transporter substrate-binding protein [bacterium]
MNDTHCRPYGLVVIPIIFMMMALGCATTGPGLGAGSPPTTQGKTLFMAAERSFEKGDLEQAAAGYEKVLGSESDSYIADNALFRMGEIAMHQGDYVKALKLFELLPTEYPESELIPSARFQAARSLYLNLSWERALHALHKFREDFPMSQHNPAVMLLLSDIYIKTREYARSKEVLATFFSQYPRSPLIASAKYQLGLSEMYLGETEQAFSHLKEALTGELPDDQREDALYALATLSLMKDDLLSSVEYFSDLYRTIETGDRKERVLKKVTGLIQARLRDEDLRSLIERHPREFPGDLALIEMAERSFNRGEISDVRHYLAAFQSSFPGHPETSALQERLNVFEKEPGLAAAGKFGCIAPLTDLFAGYGEKMIRGVKMAIEEYNQKNGTDLKVVLFDSMGKPENAQKGVEVLAYEDKVTAIIGPLLTASATSAARTAERIGVPLFTPTAAGEGVPEIGRFIFRNCLTNRHQAESLATYAVEELGLTDFGVLFPFNAYGKEMMALFSDKVEALGAHVEIIEFYDQDDTDFQEQLVRIHQVEPEALFIPGSFEKIVLIAPQIPFYAPEEEDPNDPNALAEGMESLSEEDEIPLIPPEIAMALEDDGEKKVVEAKREMQLLGTDGWYDQRLIVEGESYVEKAILSVGFYRESPDPLVRKFVSDFQKRYGEPPDLVSAQAYDATNMILEASNGGMASWESTRKKLSEIRDFPGVSGRTTILPSGDSVKEVTLLRVKRRRFVPVEWFSFNLN